MVRFRDRTGETYGQLTAIRRSGSGCPVKWECVCSCGKHVVMTGNNLNSAKSCGCLRSPAHLKGHPARHSYWSAKMRCENRNDPAYRNYGGRGIEFRFKSMEAFWEELGSTWKFGLSVDRIDNDGHYEPGNCRWATAQEQATNKRTTIRVKHNGETLCLAEWSRKLGIGSTTLRYRYSRYGNNPERLFNDPKEYHRVRV